MNKWVWIVIVVIILAGGLWWWSSMQNSSADQAASTTTDMSGQDMGNMGTSTPTTDTGTGATVSVGATVGTAPMSATVTYNGSSFSPASVTIAQGGTVNFVDQNGGAMWIASNPHPIHNGYDGTTLQQHCAAGYTGATPFDECTTGTSYSFTFQKVGAWGYHNHMNPGVQGTVNVVAQ